jgi:hypothetical protein
MRSIRAIAESGQQKYDSLETLPDYERLTD